MITNTSPIRNQASALSLVPAVAPVENFEDRWAAWVAKGRKHETRARRRFTVGAIIVAAVAAIVAFIVLR
jgi:hypothetical protein